MTCHVNYKLRRTWCAWLSSKRSNLLDPRDIRELYIPCEILSRTRCADCTCIGDMSVRTHELRKLIDILKMIVQIMSCDKCVSHTSLDTDCARCKSPIFTYYTYCTNCTDDVARSLSVSFVNHTIMRDLRELHELIRRLASRALHKKHELRE